MIDKQIHFVGVRFTEKEKVIIDRIIQKRKTSYNQFIREAVLSHINNLDSFKSKINMSRIDINISNFKKILPEMIRNIHNLYRELEAYKLNIKPYFIT